MFNLNTTKKILFTFVVSMYQELGKSLNPMETQLVLN